MAQPIPVATSTSIPISAATSSTPPQSPHAKGSPRISLTGVQSNFSLSSSPTLKSILKSTSASPRTEPSSPSPKSVSSSKEGSPRLKFASYPEVDRLKTASDAELREHLLRIYAVFEGTKATLQKLKNQLLVMIDLHQENIFGVFKSAVNADSITLQEPYESLIRARSRFLQVFNPWEEEAINPGQAEQEQNEIRNRVLIGFRLLAKEKDISCDEDPKLRNVLLSPACQEYTQRLRTFKKHLQPLCEKYSIKFAARLKTYRFMKGNEHCDSVSDWISKHVLRDVQAYHLPTLTQMDDETVEALNTHIVDQKDRDILRNLMESFGKERSLILDYNRTLVSFYVRNTQILSSFMKSSNEDAIIKIQIRAVWQLSQLIRFVHRLDRYLQNVKLNGKEKVERIQSLLKLNTTKCFKIFARAIEFGKTCEQLYIWLRMLSDRSSWSGYRDMQALVNTELIQYLDANGFLSKKDDNSQQMACSRSSSS